MVRFRVQPSDIAIPKDNPFEKDRLDRKETVEILAGLIGSVKGPCVLGIDADWGNGKTTFLRMLNQYLVNKGVAVVNFNAWECDYASDPLIAISTEIDDAMKEYAEEYKVEIKEKILIAMKRAKELLQSRTPAILRSLLAQVPVAGPALGEVIDGLAATYADERLSAYRQARKSVEQFRSALRDMAGSVSQSGKDFPLVLMIDELDRCRPSYAVELLEVAKHLFSVDGIVFVLAVNRRELAHSIQALYGNSFDAPGYLGRFFDVDFRLPDPDRSDFIKSTIESVGIPRYLRRTSDRDGVRELPSLESLFETFFGESTVSLRTVARAVHHLGLVYASMADNRLVLATTSAVLLILRTIDRNLYYRFVGGLASDLDVVDSVVERFGMDARTEHERTFVEFEAWIVVSQVERDHGTRLIMGDIVDTPLMERYKAVVAERESEADSFATQEFKRARDVLGLVAALVRESRGSLVIRFQATVQRIELLSPDLGDRDSDA